MHFLLSDLESGLDFVQQSPRIEGVLALIVRRPRTGAREVVPSGRLDLVEGLMGDNWNSPRGRGEDGLPNPETQLTVMNARVIDLVAGSRERWPFAGDQRFVDLDQSEENLPAGTRISVGSAVIEITREPHRGCGAFADRFGRDALRFVTDVGRPLRLRGANTRVVRPGKIRVGDAVRKATDSRLGRDVGRHTE